MFGDARTKTKLKVLKKLMKIYKEILDIRWNVHMSPEADDALLNAQLEIKRAMGEIMFDLYEDEKIRVVEKKWKPKKEKENA